MIEGLKLPQNYDSLDFSERRIVRELYVQAQNGNCHYCKEPLNGEPSSIVLSKKINYKLFPPNFFKYPVHLHHSHTTGITIGAVHCKCNAVLWQYEGE